MVIEKIHLKNFRNFVNLEIDLSRGINLFIGDNGSGKTNLLEAIHYLSFGKPIRSVREDDMIRFSSNYFYLLIKYIKDEKERIISIHYSKESKNFKKDDIDLKKKSDLIGELVIIPFSPEDADVIRGGASQRRRALDIVLCSANREYLETLKWYNRSLKQRNALLNNMRNSYETPEELTQWNKMLSDYGIYLMEKREEMLKDIKSIIAELVDELKLPYKHFEVSYKPSIENNSILKTLENNLKKDLKYGWTTAGPHRDDISFSLNRLEVARFASRGQQRLFSIIFRIAEVEIYFRRVYEYPVIIIDEAFIELDKCAVRTIEDKLSNYPQVIMASADNRVIDRRKVKKSFYIERGEIEEKKI